MTWTSTSGEHLPEASWPPLICFINSKVWSTNRNSPLTRNDLRMFRDYCQRSNVKEYATLDTKEEKSLPEEFLCSYFTVNPFLWRSFTSNHSHDNPRITCPPPSPDGLRPPPHLLTSPSTQLHIGPPFPVLLPTVGLPHAPGIFICYGLIATACCDSGVLNWALTPSSISIPSSGLKKNQRLDQNSQMFPRGGKRLFPLYSLLWQPWWRCCFFRYQINEAALKTLNLLQTTATMSPFSHEPHHVLCTIDMVMKSPQTSR